MRFAEIFIVTAAIVGAYGSSEDGYVVNEPASKAYKLMYEAQTWQKARQVCVTEGAQLAVPKTQDEFQFIQKIVRGMHYPSVTGTTYKLLAWLGINNLENYKQWKNLEGEDIEQTGFHQWSGNNGDGYSDNPAEPHCVGIDAINPGLRDYWCHRKQPFVCEKRLN